MIMQSPHRCLPSRPAKHFHKHDEVERQMTTLLDLYSRTPLNTQKIGRCRSNLGATEASLDDRAEFWGIRLEKLH